jgi:hypothetical protein
MKKNSLGRGFLAIVLSATLLGSGCANWVDTAVADLPVITQIVTSIVTIVAGATGDPNMITEVQNICTQATTDIKTVQGLVNDYKAAAAGAKPGILAKIQAGLAAIQKDFQDILTAFQGHCYPNRGIRRYSPGAHHSASDHFLDAACGIDGDAYCRKEEGCQRRATCAAQAGRVEEGIQCSC